MEDLSKHDLQALEKLWNEKADQQLRLDRQLREIADEIDQIVSAIAVAKAAA
jgi:hypothetical protein